MSEKLKNILPRHIRKLIKSADLEAESRPEYFSSMDQAKSAFGSVGTDKDYTKLPVASKQLIQEISAYHHVSEPQILLSSDQQQVIDLCIRTICRPGEDNIITLKTGDELIQKVALLNNIEVHSLDLEMDFQMPLFAIKRAIDKHTRLIYLQNPNFIQGNCFANFDIVDLATSFDGILLVDESLIDYSMDKSLISMIELCENVIVVQNFSNSWGLAAMPLSVVFADPFMIEALSVVQSPHAVNYSAQKVVQRALYLSNQHKRNIEKLSIQKNQMIEALNKMQVVLQVFPSDSNTILVQVQDANALCAYLKEEHHIILMNTQDKIAVENCVRFTVQDAANNVKLLKAIKEMPRYTSKGYVFLRRIGKTLKKASMYLGVFKKIFSTGS